MRKLLPLLITHTDHWKDNSLIDHPRGQLASECYDDLIDGWLYGEYPPMLWTDEQLKTHLKSKPVLSPTERELFQFNFQLYKG